MISCNDPQMVLTAALDLGAQMQICGGEISRVEDTIARICRAYGASKVEVMAITAGIIVTMGSEEFGMITQTRRVTEQKYNLSMLSDLNNLSREVCAEQLPAEVFIRRVEKIKEAYHQKLSLTLMECAMIGCSFTIFFGGSLIDGIYSGLLSVFLKYIQFRLGRIQLNSYFSIIACSILGGILTILPGVMGFHTNQTAISIGSIMLFIPGIMLTNGIRDMFSGDTISGLMRFAESLVLSLTIAWGFAVGTAGASNEASCSAVIALLTAFFGCLGFGILFQVSIRDGVIGAIGGTIAWGIVLLCSLFTLQELTGYFLAAAFLTVWSEIYARRRHCPVTIFLVVGTIILVPGGSLYYTMRYLVTCDWNLFALQGLQTLLYAVAIAAGIICVTTIADVLKHLRRKS